ncbi:MAG: TetR/AcrR family transcriptional regulator, partial [Waddliaceae bacterium]
MDVTAKSKRRGRASVCAGAARILKVAESLFADKGFSAVSMSTIAKKAKVSKANIYHHFKTKEDLYLAILRQAGDEIAYLLESLNVQRKSAIERLEVFLITHLKILMRQENVTKLLLREVMEGSPKRQRDIVKKGFSKPFSYLVKIIREGQKSGELRANIDPSVIATMFISVNVFYFQNSHMLGYLPEVKFAN